MVLPICNDGKNDSCFESFNHSKQLSLRNEYSFNLLP